MTYIDLSLPFTNDTPVFPGDPPVSITPFLTIPKDGCSVYSYGFSGHTGTHIDAPSHFIEGGKTHADVAIDRYTGKGVLVEAVGKNVLDVDILEDVVIDPDSILLIRTDYVKNAIGEESFFEESPHMTEGLAKKLVELQIKIVGLDVPNPDREPYPVHKILLGNEIMIIESLCNLDRLTGKDFTVMAFPLAVPTDGIPLRVVALI